MFKVGDKVRFISDKMHEKSPQYFPPVGTIGEVVSLDSVYNYTATIRWEKGTTSGRGEWGVKDEWIELITEIKTPKLTVKAQIRAISIGDTITIKGRKYKYVEDGSEAVVLYISDKTIVCRMSDGSLFTIDKKDCKLVAEEVVDKTTPTAKMKMHNRTPKKTTIEVGDRVVCVMKYGIKPNKGDLGEVLYISDGGTIFHIRWDKYIGGHDCEGRCEFGHGWNVRKENIRLATEEEKEPHDTNFAVGEWVRIRDWEDMEKDGEINDEENIEFASGMNFVESMRPLCGMYVRISKIYEDDKDTKIEFDNELYDVDACWTYTTDMIEKIPTYKAGDKVRVRSLEALKKNWGNDVKMPMGAMWGNFVEKYCGKTFGLEGGETDQNNVCVDDRWYISKFAVEKVS